MRTSNHTLLVAVVAIALVASNRAAAQSTWEKPLNPPPKHELQAPAVEKNLKVFDFELFSGQKWARLGESHAKDIVVTWPDGHETRGIESISKT